MRRLLLFGVVVYYTYTMDPTFFPTPDDFRGWLVEHHAGVDELWVGFYRKSTGRPSITWPESVDEALCFGWIDGIRKTVDEEAYMIRFTPRRSGSHWSRVNLERVTVLIEERRMSPAGMAAYEARDPEKSARYSYERETAAFTKAQLGRLRANRQAWKFWQAQPAGSRKQVTAWVTTAKKEETRERRLATLVEDCANGLRIKQLRRG
jgi:uncharacterized protein YdeI (YjbR/CyaY-like superfamily)